MVATFWQSNSIKGGSTAFYHRNCHGICKASVLAGGNQHAAENKVRIFSRCYHTSKPVQSRIWVSASQAFDKGTDNVVVVVAVSVVKHHLFLNAFFRRLLGDVNLRAFSGNWWGCLWIPVFWGSFHCQLQCVQKASGISVGGIHQMLQGTSFKNHLPAAVASISVLEGGGGCLKKMLAFQGQ